MAMTAFESRADLVPLPFDPAKLNGLSERMIRSHWENNYGGSVKALSTVKQRLAQAQADKDLPPFVYNDLKREHLLRTGSVVFHELYFGNLGGGAVKRVLPSARRSRARSAASRRGKPSSAVLAPGSGAAPVGWYWDSTATCSSSRTTGLPTMPPALQPPSHCW